MSKQAIENNINEIIAAIQLCLNAKKHLPTLILIFSTIDVLAWLNRPNANPDVTGKDFISWVDQFMLPGSGLHCSATDLYSARCGIVHSYQAESKLTREGKAKQLWYAWGKADATRLMTRINQTHLDKIAIAVQVELLFDALKKGFAGFLKALEPNPTHATLVYERAAKKFFGFIPYDSI
jgi:hypothetical protein